MSSAITILQRAIVEGKQPLTQLLRTAKLIAARLELQDMSQWVDLELNGYPADSPLPPYRSIAISHVEIHHPYRGWEFAGPLHDSVPAREAIGEIETLSTGDDLCFNIRRKLPVRDLDGNRMSSDWPQRAMVDSDQFKRILDAVRNQLLNWTIQLEKQGIRGDDMEFGSEEKNRASHITFNVGQAGIVSAGNVSNSQVAIYDFSSVHQVLKENGIPQEERNALENLMDDLKRETDPAKKTTLLEKGREWVIKNQKALGSALNIVLRALGLSVDDLGN